MNLDNCNYKRMQSFLLSNKDVKELILSFHFGERDYELEYKYDTFYNTIPPHIISKNFYQCYKTQTVCNNVLQQHPSSLMYVPDAMKTYEMCYNSIILLPSMFNYVPYELRTYELIRSFSFRTLI